MKIIKLRNMIISCLLLLLMIVFVYPLIVMVFGSFKDAAELAANPAGFPIRPTLDNYKRLLAYGDGLFFRGLINSVFISSI